MNDDDEKTEHNVLDATKVWIVFMFDFQHESGFSYKTFFTEEDAMLFGEGMKTSVDLMEVSIVEYLATHSTKLVLKTEVESE